VDPQVGLSQWKTPEAAARFRDLYAGACDDVCRELEAGGRPKPEILDVASRFGTTRCLHWPGAGDPVLLLHGHNGSWLAWAPLLAELADRDVYTLDTVGDPGGSTQIAPIPSVAELVEWLRETLDALDLQRPNVMGMSYGGWIAAHFAATHPERVAALVLIEPAIGTVTMGRVVRQGMKVALAQLLPTPLRRAYARRIDAEPLVFDVRQRKPAALAFRKFDRRIPTYARLDDPTPDHMLTAIGAPTLLVLAGRSELHDITEVADRTRRLIRHLDIHIVDGASHAVPVTRPRAVADIVESFLDRTDGTTHHDEP